MVQETNSNSSRSAHIPRPSPPYLFIHRMRRYDPSNFRKIVFSVFLEYHMHPSFKSLAAEKTLPLSGIYLKYIL